MTRQGAFNIVELEKGFKIHLAPFPQRSPVLFITTFHRMIESVQFNRTKTHLVADNKCRPLRLNFQCSYDSLESNFCFVRNFLLFHPQFLVVYTFYFDLVLCLYWNNSSILDYKDLNTVQCSFLSNNTRWLMMNHWWCFSKSDFVVIRNKTINVNENTQNKLSEFLWLGCEIIRLLSFIELSNLSRSGLWREMQ